MASCRRSSRSTHPNRSRLLSLLGLLNDGLRLLDGLRLFLVRRGLFRGCNLGRRLVLGCLSRLGGRSVGHGGGLSLLSLGCEGTVSFVINWRMKESRKKRTRLVLLVRGRLGAVKEALDPVREQVSARSARGLSAQRQETYLSIRPGERGFFLSSTTFSFSLSSVEAAGASSVVDSAAGSAGVSVVSATAGSARASSLAVKEKYTLSASV